MNHHLRLVLVVPMLVACGGPSELPSPMLAGEGFFDAPWPSDSRMVDGHLDLSGFPRTGEFVLLDKYLALAGTLDGFGTNAAIYMRFSSAPETDLLPDPDQSAQPGQPVFLLDIDPTSPHRGERVPYTWDLQEEENDWVPANLLAVQPVWGFPLRGATTYALVVTTEFATASASFASVWDEASAEHARFAPLAATLGEQGIGVDSVAAATVFTTQDPRAEMVRLADAIHTDLPTPALDQTLEQWNRTSLFEAYEGTVRVPLWQHGDKPYMSEGGGFEFTEDGTPLLAGWETVKFTLTLPRHGDEPDDGWPVVLNAHGTGGDDRSHAEGMSRLSPAAVLADAGMALFEISQPLHGDRGTGIDPTLVSFNYLNPSSARATFRQGALDQVYLARLLSARQHCFSTDDGREGCTDPRAVTYLGHSQGGVVGAMAVPFFRGDIRAAVLSGAGGGLSVSLLDRDITEIDVDALLSEQLDISLGELDQAHPLVAVVQTLSEVTDPINYGQFWFQEQAEPNAVPVSVLQTEGTIDQFTPPQTIEALAGVAGLPILDPVAQSSEVARMRDLVGEPLPAMANLSGWDGEAVTGGLMQYPDQDHFVIFDDANAADLYQQFLVSSREQDAPELR